MSAIRRDIFTLLQNYASLTPLRFIQFPPKISFSDMNSNLVDFILLNPLLQKYPPSKQYQRSFWKAAISHLETLLAESNGEDEEIDPRILDHYLSILPSSGPLSGSSSAELRDQICDRGLPLGEMPSRSFVTHFWRLDLVQESISGVVNLADYQSSSVEESRTMIERGTTGLRTWFASHMLARYLMQNTSIVEGKRLLELGSGTGFLGIIAASLQQLQLNSKKTTLLESSSVWLTDVNEEVLTQCRRNVQLPCNLSSTHQFMHFQLLDWEEALKPDVATLKDYLQNEINPDVILGADLIFDPALVAPLVALLVLALQSGSRTTQRYAIIAQTIRNAETFQLFWDHARENGLLLRDINLPQSSELGYFIDHVEPGVANGDVRTLRITLDDSV